ncbi:MAG: cellulase family glycosylhydrolase [Planctomycetota bacterium]|jgi:hypothetical protein
MRSSTKVYTTLTLIGLCLFVTGQGGPCVPPPPNGTGQGQVSSTSPTNGATNIATNTTISITFNQAANTDSLDGSINPQVDFTTNWSSDNTVVTIVPSANLAQQTQYTINISSVSFANGSTLGSPYTFSFTTIGDVISVSDKWELWSSGQTLLRGADLHPCTVTNTENFTCATPTTKQDVQALRNMGANLINASYPGLYNEQPPYDVNTTAQQYMDDLINWAEEIGIYVVIHVRTGPGRNAEAITNTTGNPLWTVWTDQAAHDAWIAMWRYMAQRYSNSPVVIGYHLMVEPHVNSWLDPQATLTPQAFNQQHAGTLGDWNNFAAQITAAIRQVDTQTPIIINSLQWANASWFPALVPTSDARTVYSVHPYDPDIYTAQEDNAPVSYPSTVEGTNFNRDWLVNNLQPVLNFAQQHNVPIYVGEHGLFRWVSNGAAFISDLTGLFEQYGWNYAYYVWRGDETDFNGYNIEYGSDRNNTNPIPNNPLQAAFTAHWSKNTNFP